MGRADRHARIYSRRGTPHQERTEGKCNNSAGNTTSTDSGTYTPSSKGIGYPPKIFINPRYLQNGIESNTDNESEAEPLVPDSKPPSDRDEDLIDITQTENALNKK